MRHRQRLLPGMEAHPRKVTKAETFQAVKTEFLRMLRLRGTATVDAIREILDIPVDALPAIGRAIAHLSETGQIVPVEFAASTRSIAHGRPIRVWRLAQTESPTAQG